MICSYVSSDGLLYEKLGSVDSYDLKRCALISVYVYSFVILKIVSGYFECFVIVVQWVLYSFFCELAYVFGVIR